MFIKDGYLFFENACDFEGVGKPAKSISKPINMGPAVTSWKAIPGLPPGYQASPDGFVRNVVFRGGKYGLLTGAVYHDNHIYLKFKFGNYGLHQLIALTFLGDKPSPAHGVSHLDNNPHNNAVSNLKWDTQLGNCLHASATGRISKKARCLTAAQRAAIKVSTVPHAEICAEYGISYTTVSRIKNDWYAKHQERERTQCRARRLRTKLQKVDKPLGTGE